MPIVHIHGVATRDPQDLEQREAMLRRYITDELKHDDVPGDVPVLRTYWGDQGATFAWNLQSCPTQSLLSMGAGAALTPATQAQQMAEFTEQTKNLPTTPPPAAAGGRLIAPGVTMGAANPRIRLKDLTEDQLSDLAVSTVLTKQNDTWQETLAIIAADDVARQPATFALLAAEPDTTAEITRLQQLIAARYDELEAAQTGLLKQGPSWLGDLKDRLLEALTRADDASGYALTRVLNQLRPRLNQTLILFFGDVFTYLTRRGTPEQPGEITQRLLDQLAAAHRLQQERHGEPIVLLSHSMGGQIVYDVLTHFLPNMPQYQHIKVDFWCATASQVGVFEEMKLLAESDPAHSLSSGKKVSLPPAAHLGYWWNVWDSNDYLSFTAKVIFDGIDDAAYDSGMSLAGAHSGYLQQPSFYRTFAKKLRTHLPPNWFRP